MQSRTGGYTLNGKQNLTGTKTIQFCLLCFMVKVSKIYAVPRAIGAGNLFRKVVFLMITTKQLAVMTGRAPVTIRLHARRGRIRGEKIGRDWLFDEPVARAYCEETGAGE